MAAEVDICNLALGHLGDVANVAVINPPDGSAQSEHCQRFYPLARDTLLEMNDWTFATRRATLAAVTSPASTWQYAYAMPTGALNFLAVLDPAAQDDYSTGIGTSPYSYETMSAGPLIDRGMYTPQDFAIETDLNGSEIVLTNQVNAVGRFVIRITDTSKFSNHFVDALAWLLASHLAGPVLKGAAGTAAAKACAEVFQGRFTMACNSDSGQRKTSTRSRHAVSWINGR